MITNLKTIIAVFTLAAVLSSCSGNREPVVSQAGISEKPVDTGLIIVAKDIITEVILSRVEDGDPWEAEKIQGYDGKQMTDKLFEDIYSGKLIVYDYFSGLELSPGDVKKIEGELVPDRYAIGKMQFTEDWYLDTETDAIVKEIKSVVFGTERKDPSGSIIGYKAIFQVKYQN